MAKGNGVNIWDDEGNIKLAQLTTGDTHKLIKLLQKIDIKKEIENFAGSIKGIGKYNAKDGLERSIEKQLLKNPDNMVKLLGAISATVLNCASKAPDELDAFLAAAVGISVEEYHRLPLGTELEIIEAIKGSEDFKRFFTLAFRLLGLK